jgi:general secretion pathway protein K
MRNERGVALIITLFSIMVMTFLAFEISYNARVEMAVGASNLDRLRAYYLAKSGVQLSILRLSAYKTAVQRFGAQLGPNKSALDMIWQFPFAWPPSLPEEASSFDKDAVKKAIKESYIDGAFASTIEVEGAKIDVNDLASPSERLRDSVMAQLAQILQNRLDADDDWARENRDLRVQEIINNIADWVDENADSLNGGAESAYYSKTEPPITPPNRPMKTLAELHMVAGITDDLYNILAPRLTVYGSKGINVNFANAEVLSSIDKQITAEVAAAIIARRGDPNQGGPYKDLDDFKTFIQGKGVNVATFNQKPEIPLLFDAEYNFRIRSTGVYKRAQREIIAIVYDFDKVKGQLSLLMATPTPTATPATPGGPATPTPTATPTATPGQQGSSGPPQIIFWQEF